MTSPDDDAQDLRDLCEHDLFPPRVRMHARMLVEKAKREERRRALLAEAAAEERTWRRLWLILRAKVRP